MPLQFEVRIPDTIPVEVEGLLPEKLCVLGLEEIRRLPVLSGNREVEAGDVFRITGSCGDDFQIRFAGDCRHVKRIGVELSEGEILVEGSAGMHLGGEMKGGTIRVLGDVSDWAGAEMSGGRISIRGNAGEHLGGAYRGAKRGMTGGEILVEGNCGHEAGHAMRRGLIAVGRDLGDAAGFQMSGGTILAFGKLGVQAGAGLKRGTICWLGEGERPRILPTYQRSTRMSPVFLRVYVEHLRGLGFPVPEGCLESEYRRYCGDFLELGRGEILLREAA